MSDRQFGEVAGNPEGSSYADRIHASQAGVHRPRQAGISGGATSGADSIVVSGGYVDDEDYGDRIIYTGHGGNDKDTGKQIANQELTRGNMALAISADEGFPVRVIRGSGGEPAHSPSSGYRYDGLYTVSRYWPAPGRNGFRIWRFELSKISDPAAVGAEDSGQGADRSVTTVQRLVRNTQLGTEVKAIHKHRCQICGETVQVRSGQYAEAAHIRPLGSPHNGPDALNNLLCLCPNCHVRFDRLAIYLTDQLQIVDALTGSVLGDLRTSPRHALLAEHVSYQREMCGA